MDKISKKELGYLIGFYMGDGYSNYNPNDRHYRVNFYFHSEQTKMQNRIKSFLKQTGLKPFTLKDKECNSIKIFVNSKKLMKYLETMTEKIKNNSHSSKKLKIGLISGFIDAEGYVNNGEILLTQKDKSILILIKKMLKSVKIDTRKFWSEDNYKSENKIWRMRISTQFKNLNHNSYKVEAQYGIKK